MVVAKFATTTQHGAIEGKTQTHEVNYFNLDVIISVGYRVKSKNGVAFRRWANNVLKQYLVKGFAINDRIRRKQIGELRQLVQISNPAWIMATWRMLTSSKNHWSPLSTLFLALTQMQ